MVTGLAGFVGAKGTIGVVEGTVTGVEAGLVGETVMMVGVSGGVITGEGGVGELVVFFFFALFSIISFGSALCVCLFLSFSLFFSFFFVSLLVIFFFQFGVRKTQKQ